MPCPLKQDRVEDKSCDIEIGNVDADTKSLNSDDNMTCVICLDQFKVDDLVSWSANGKCDHIYHEDCILNWLLKRSDCPYCRCEYITLEEEVDCKEKSERECLTFCYSHGLISTDCA